MSEFPKTCIMTEGSVYRITFEDVKLDWQETVRQFDDLSKEEQEGLLDGFTENQAETWWQEQCMGGDIPRIGTFLYVDEDVRNDFLKQSLIQGAWSQWASEYEVDLE